jgi:hypothetical protein
MLDSGIRISSAASSVNDRKREGYDSNDSKLCSPRSIKAGRYGWCDQSINYLHWLEVRYLAAGGVSGEEMEGLLYIVVMGSCASTIVWAGGNA